MSPTTIIRWAEAGEVKRRPSLTGYCYHRRSIVARAKTYWAWALNRYKRAVPPAWLSAQEAA